MKKYLLVLPLLALMMSACGHGGSSSSSQEQSSSQSSESRSESQQSESKESGSESKSSESKSESQSQSESRSESQSSGEQSSEQSSSETSSGQESSSSKKPATKDVTILCYLDYNHANQDSDAYYTAKWYYGVPFTKEDIGLVDPTKGSYPEFPTFLGWSMQPIIDSEDQLFKWGEYIRYKDGTGAYINLYGIWVSE